MQIAILGAGFSGVAVAWNLVQNKQLQVHLYDPSGVGGEASKIAAGLLHKYSGAHAKLNRFGIESEAASRELIKIAEEALQSTVILSKGILRVALNEEKKQEYSERAKQYEDCRWVEPKECLALTHGSVGHSGLFIQDGLTIDCFKYLQGLWKATEKMGAKFFDSPIEKLSQLSHYDAIVVATGATALQFKELSHLKVTAVKGQLLEFVWPNVEPLDICLNAEAYITMMPGGKACVAGSTYEKTFTSTSAELKLAKELLLPKITALYPPLQNAEIIGCRAGLRASTPDHLPLIGQFGDKLFVITGMGSKGLLYHAIYGKNLSNQIIKKLIGINSVNAS